MSCCDNPEFTSSTYSDECLNCGWWINYLTGDEGYNITPSTENSDND